MTGVLLLPGTAGAVGTGGASPFAMAPAIQKGQPVSSYFKLSMGPGSTKKESVNISDTGRNPETLKLSASRGVTAPNSGASYAGAYSPCVGTACWIRGLPSRVAVGAGQTKKVTFTVTVPAGTAERQYLAGVTAEPAHSGHPVVVGHNGNTTARAIVINQITVGVAVTVGPLSALRSALTIPKVSAVGIGKTPRLLVKVRNVGQRFTNAKGSADCTSDGHRHSYAVLANTILPGDSAVVDVNASGLAANSLSRCAISLPFGGKSARWTGNVKVPSLKVPKTVHNKKGQYTVVPGAVFPTWAIGVMAGGGSLLAALLVIFTVFMRRYRRQAKTAAAEA